MKASWFHSPAAHGLLVVVVTMLAFAISFVIKAVDTGVIVLSPGLVIYLPLMAGLLTIAGVALRNWLESNRAAQPPLPPTPPSVTVTYDTGRGFDRPPLQGPPRG